MAANSEGVSAGVAFVPVTGEDFDLADIKVTGVTSQKTPNAIEAQTLNEFGGTDRSFMWKDYKNPLTSQVLLGWYENNKTDYTTLPADKKVKIDPGKGIFVVTQCDQDIKFVWPKVELGE